MGIIGLIADMTIPTLVYSIQTQILKTRLKKSYSSLSQALELMKVDKGSDLSWALEYNVEEDKYLYIDEFISSYMKTLKTTGLVKYPADAKNFVGKPPYLGLSEAFTKDNEVYALPDGSLVYPYINHYSVEIFVDTNGLKGPNRAGFDIFEFYANKDTKYALVPLKKTDESPSSEEDIANNIHNRLKGTPCTKTSTVISNGMGCAWYALNDINPDNKNETYWENLPR